LSYDRRASARSYGARTLRSMRGRCAVHCPRLGHALTRRAGAICGFAAQPAARAACAGGTGLALFDQDIASGPNL